MKTLKIKLLRPKAKMPTRSFNGYDLYSPMKVICLPDQVTQIPIGIATELPFGYAAFIWDLGKREFTVFGGVIDSDFRGEWVVKVYNSTKEVYIIEVNERVAQAVFQKIKLIDREQVYHFTESR